MTSAGCIRQPRDTTHQRFSTDCSVCRRCVLEGCFCSKIQYHPNHDTGSKTSAVMHNADSSQHLTTMFPNLKFDHRDVYWQKRDLWSKQCRSHPIDHVHHS
ncbi:hypothetical protein TNCV_4883231 [Trichonephila clavipes]|nr:hypothetical protein TNCV_4883231 [Trichonephila clavipes]